MPCFKPGLQTGASAPYDRNPGGILPLPPDPEIP